MKEDLVYPYYLTYLKCSKMTNGSLSLLKISRFLSEIILKKTLSMFFS